MSNHPCDQRYAHLGGQVSAAIFAFQADLEDTCWEPCHQNVEVQNDVSLECLDE